MYIISMGFDKINLEKQRGGAHFMKLFLQQYTEGGKV